MDLNQSTLLIIFAEDDHEDWMLIEDAFEECPGVGSLRHERVLNGVELLERIRDPSKEFPDMVFLDLKMPMKNGHEVLQEIRRDENLRALPVVIMTASSSEADIFNTYYSGANSFIAKPVSPRDLHAIQRYWADLVSLPRKKAPMMGAFSRGQKSGA